MASSSCESVTFCILSLSERETEYLLGIGCQGLIGGEKREGVRLAEGRVDLGIVIGIL